MKEFEAKTVCILGRLPALGIAELESLFGAEHVRPLDGHALLDVAAEDINFKMLGGTIKTARILAKVPSTRWEDLAKYLVDNVPQHMRYQPEGKFTFGLSVYGLKVSVKQIERTALEVKKAIRQTGKSVRVVPNKALELNSAQVLHNKLTQKGAWELVYIKEGGHTLLAQTLFVQDIEAYGARDQARPARDARVGMLPPKLAQTLINLAVGMPDGDPAVVLDPFCGTGVILQEALLMGYDAIGTDIDPRMVEYSKKNLDWLRGKYPVLQGDVSISQADATSHEWSGFTAVAGEAFLGRPLARFPAEADLKQIMSDANTIIRKFLINLSHQLSAGQAVCLAVPAWRRPDGKLIALPLIDHLTEMGYNYWDLKHVRREDLVYYREDQIVARQILRLRKA
ncbi:MAG TPA: DNA methyltransferase [Candidatus Saccharimonadales bacterium]|nr:DNA methyltransferase [Candidatus Saccharimonadales bacterium]